MVIVVSVMILYLRFCLANSLTAEELYGDGVKPDCPVIKTTLGNIAGIRQRTVLGHSSFCSYRGIRYAEAPIGELRFKAPVLSSSWNGTYDATEYGSACLQFDSTYTNQSEDCLFLNVFVPEPSICTNSSDIAVIAYVHGGGFINEAADDNYGPYLLLNECVILVTFNYRLDVFGFLPLALPEYSGNMGLKDQQLALEWVNRHISAFGGNPERVTLMGQSAGGTSVSFQRLNPISRSYFKRAYVMSGGALVYYALSESNNKTNLIVEIAKSQSITIENSAQLIDYLQTVDARFLLKHSLHDINELDLTFYGLWQPCVEPETASNPFITEDPELLLSVADELPPTIYTYTSMEAISKAADIIAKPAIINNFDTNFIFTLPFHSLNQVACEKEVAPILTGVRRFYFGHAKINETQILPFIQLLSFNNLAYPMLKEVALQALSKSAEIRLLRVNLRTQLSQNLHRSGVASLAGTSHSDDICSYFWCKFMKDIYEEIATEETLAQQSTVRTSRILREILTSFAITGDPLSRTGSNFHSFPLVNANPLTDLAFTELLSISTLASGSNPDHEQFKFWWDVNQRVDKIKKMTCNQN